MMPVLRFIAVALLACELSDDARYARYRRAARQGGCA